jgi:Condensation domain
MEDLSLAYRQLSAEREARLPPKTTTFKRWAVRLSELGRSDELRGDLDYYLSLPTDKISELPVDHRLGPNTVGSAETVSLELSPAYTDALLRDTPMAYGTQINDVLLTALSLALTEWSGSPAQ